MTTEQLAKILRKRAEKKYPIDPKAWGLIPCNNDLSLLQREAYLAGANDALEIGKLLGRIEAHKNYYGLEITNVFAQNAVTKYDEELQELLNAK